MSILSTSLGIGFRRPGIIGMICVLAAHGFACFTAFFYGAGEFFGIHPLYADTVFMRASACATGLATACAIFAALSGRFWDGPLFPAFFTNVLACGFGIIGGSMLMQWLDGRGDFSSLACALAFMGSLGAAAAMIPSREKAVTGITFLMAFAVFSLAWMVLMGEKSAGMCWAAMAFTLASLAAPQLVFAFLGALGVAFLAIIGAGVGGSWMTLRK